MKIDVIFTDLQDMLGRVSSIVRNHSVNGALTGPLQTIETVVEGFSSKNSKATYPQDKRDIDGKLLQFFGGFSEVDRHVRGAFTNALSKMRDAYGAGIFQHARRLDWSDWTRGLRRG